MENIIKKIFLGKAENGDGEVHSAFIKFGRGIFEDRYLIEGKRQKDKWAIKTSAEFANFFVKRCLENVEGEVEMKGIIVSTFDLRDKIDFEIEKVKNYMGIKQIVINTVVEASKIISLMDEFPRAFFALSFKTNDCELKIKAKPPKSAKPASKGEAGPKANFCSLKTPNQDIINDLFFDFPNFKEIKINHTITIEKINLPKGEENPVKIRELSEREGIVKRIAIVDGGNEVIEEKEFIA